MTLGACVEQAVCALARPVLRALDTALLALEVTLVAEITTLSVQIAKLDIQLIPVRAVLGALNAVTGAVTDEVVALIPDIDAQGCVDLGDLRKKIGDFGASITADLNDLQLQASAKLSFRDSLELDLEGLNQLSADVSELRTITQVCLSRKTA